MDNLASAERPLLPHVPPPQRGPLMNRFLEPVRRGMTTDPDVIVQYVIAALKEDIERRGAWNFAADVTPLQQTLLAVHVHFSEALALAREAISYEALAPDERAQLKAARARGGMRQYMAAKPPTERQLAYLKVLGVRKVPVNRLEASELIDQARRAKMGGAP